MKTINTKQAAFAFDIALQNPGPTVREKRKQRNQHSASKNVKAYYAAREARKDG